MAKWLKNRYKSGRFSLSTLQESILRKQRFRNDDIDEEEDYGKALDWIFIIGGLITIVIFIMAIVEYINEIFK